MLGCEAARRRCTVKNERPLQSDCTTVGSSALQWQAVLRSWSRGQAGTYVRKDGSRVVPVSEDVAVALELPVERVAMCLHVLDGRPVKYGVRVGS